jgi:hypothetical protein
MTDQLQQHRAEMARQAWPVVERFVQEQPHYTLDADQSGSLSNTNYVIFARQGEERVVFKYFCRDERKEREVFALRHFAATGVVPQLLAEYEQRLIVLSWIPGGWLPEPAATPLDATARAQAGYTLGQATAKLVQVPPSAATAHAFESRFYQGQILTDYIQGILQASWAIHRRVACYGDPIFADSLTTIEANLPTLLGQPRLLYHQDALNVHFADNRCTGFFDLEMCRVGTVAMQIGSLWRIIATYGLWDAFVQGFADGTGSRLGAQELAASRAFAHFMLWRSISEYGDWHGEALAAAEMATLDENAAGYRRQIELCNTV